MNIKIMVVKVNQRNHMKIKMIVLQVKKNKNNHMKTNIKRIVIKVNKIKFLMIKKIKVYLIK